MLAPWTLLSGKCQWVDGILIKNVLKRRSFGACFIENGLTYPGFGSGATIAAATATTTTNHQKQQHDSYDHGQRPVRETAKTWAFWYIENRSYWYRKPIAKITWSLMCLSTLVTVVSTVVVFQAVLRNRSVNTRTVLFLGNSCQKITPWYDRGKFEQLWQDYLHCTKYKQEHFPPPPPPPPPPPHTHTHTHSNITVE